MIYKSSVVACDDERKIKSRFCSGCGENPSACRGDCHWGFFERECKRNSKRLIIDDTYQNMI